MSEVSEVDQGVPEATGGIRWYAVVMAIGHLALLGLGGYALWQIAGGWWLGALAAGLFAVAQLAGWLLLLAPGSPRRLGYRERLTVHLVAGPIVVVVASLAGVWLPALVALSAVIMCDALNQQPRA